MKPKFYSLLALLLTIAAMAITPFQHVKAESDVVYTLEAVNGKTTGYATYQDVTVNNMIWNAPGNQTLGAFWRIGGGKSAVMDNEARDITGKTPMNAEVSSIMVCFNGVNIADVTVNSISVTVATDANFINVVEQVVLDNIAAQKGIADSVVLAPVAGDSWPIGCYYKLTFRISNAAKVNAGIDFTKAVFYGEAGVEPLPLTPVTVQLSPVSVNAFGWTQVYLWAWVTTETTSTDLFPAWPGVPVAKNDETGWYSYTFEEPLDGNLNIIWSNGLTSDYAQQTVDIPVNGTTCYELSSHVDGMGHLNYSIVDCPGVVNPNQPTITVGQAKTIGDSLAVGAKSDTTYNIVGYVTSIKENAFDGAYANMTFYIDDVIGGDNRFYVYRGKPSVELQIGDLISVKTKVYNYNGIIETESNMPVTLLEKAVNTPLVQGIYDYTKMGTTIDQWEGINAIYNASASTEIKYVFDITANNTASVNVIDEPNIFFQIRNGANKTKAFNISPGKYFEFGGKNGVVVLRNTQAGDRIILNVAAKGYSDASMLDPAGEYPKNAIVLTEDLTLPAKDEATGEYHWRDIEFLSNGGDIRIKEFASGFRIRTITIAPQNDIDTTQVLTVAQAIQFASTLAANQNTPNNIAVEGYVVQASRYDQALGYQTFWIADAIGDTQLKLQAYKATPQMNGEPCQVLEGDKVILHGPIQRYINASQEQICESYAPQVEFIALAEGDHALPEIQQVNVKQVFNYFGSMPAGRISTYCFDVTGYVTGIIENGFDQYGNMTFWMADSTDMAATSNAKGALQVYRGAVKQELKVGDYISVRTRIRCDFINNNTDSVLRSQSSAPVTLLHREQTDSVPQTIKIYCAEPMSMEYYENTRDWYLYSNNGTYGVSLDFFSNDTQSPAGVYSPNDFDYQYTNIYVGTTETKHTTVTSAEAQVIETKDSVLVNATLLGADGNTYEVYMFKQKSAGTDPIVPSGAPTPAYLSQLGYDLINNVVFCINFTGDAAVCNGVYFVGSFSNWEANFNNCPKFKPLEGYEGWYVAEAPYSDGFQGKPIQAKEDGSFSWNNQCGDPDSWTWIAGNTMSSYYGYDGEGNYYFNSAGAYIYQMSYWKNHADLCSSENHIQDVFVTLAAPKNAPAAGVEIIGSFDNWAGTTMTYEPESGLYYTTIRAAGYDEFKFREVGTWENQLQYYSSDDEAWQDFPSLFITDYWQDNGTGKLIELNFSDSTRFKWTLDGVVVPGDTIPLPEPDCYYILDMRDAYGDGWNGGSLIVKDDSLEHAYTLSGAAHERVEIPYYKNHGNVTFSWSSGLYDYEVSFTILASNGMGLYYHLADTELKSGIDLYTLTESPCQGTYNPYLPQNIKASINEDNTMTISWDAVRGASSYRIMVETPNGKTQSLQSDSASVITNTLTVNGTYNIFVTSCDIEGMPIGEASVQYDIYMPVINDATVNILVPSDCDFNVSNGLWLAWYNMNDRIYHLVPMTAQGGRIYSADFDPNAPAYGFAIVNSENPDYSNANTIWAADEVSSAMYCAEAKFVINGSYSYYNLQEVENCELIDHDYRVSNLQAVSEPGRLTFSWEAKDVAESYNIHVYNASDSSFLGYLTVYNQTSLTYLVEDNMDGIEVYWSVEVTAPLSFSEVKAPNTVTFQKSQVQISGQVTVENNTLYASWTCNVDTVDYIIEVDYYQSNYGYYTVKKETVSNTSSYAYTPTINGRYECYIVAVSKTTGLELGRYTYIGEANFGSFPEPVTALQGTAEGHHLTFTWNATVPVYAALFESIDGDYKFITSEDATANRFEYDVDHDGLYIIQLQPLVEYAPEEYSYLPIYYHASAQSFAGKTYHVELTETEGGYVFPENLSGDYGEGYVLNFRASAYNGYRFVGWSDGVTDSERSITINGPVNLQAVFELIPSYILKVEATTGGTVYVQNGWYSTYEDSYRENQSIYLEASPAEGYTFEAWSDGVTDTYRTISLTQDTTLTAIFRPLCYLTLTASDEGYIQISENYTAQNGNVYTFVYGTEVQLTAVPYSNYRFNYWSNNASAIQQTITITDDLTIAAYYAYVGSNAQYYSVNIGVQGEGAVNQLESYYIEGTPIQVTATPAEGYYFTGWSDGNTENPRGLIVNGDIAFDANFAIRTLTITLNATEGGMTYGSGTYNYGTYQTIEAIPNSGYRFVEWKENGSTEPSEELYLTEDITLTAVFEPIPYWTLTVQAGAGGQIAVDGDNWTQRFSQTYEEGSTHTIKAAANANATFIGWSDGVIRSERTITLYGDTTITALFETMATYTLTLSAGQGGQITATGMNGYGKSYTASYSSMDQVVIEAKADDGYIFSQWSDGSKAATRTLYLSEDKTLAAEFVAVHALVVTAAAGGSVSVNGYYAYENGVYLFIHGATASLSATPDNGYIFSGWDNGNTSRDITLEMNSDYTIAAAFKEAGNTPQRHISITVQPAGAGTVSDYPEYIYQGESFTITVTPNPGYQFVMWSNASTANPLTVTVGEEDINLVAIFAVKKYTLTLTAGQGGSVNDSVANGSYNYGQVVHIEATPAEHYHFLKWSDGNTVASRSIQMTADTALQAFFEGDLYTITFLNYNNDTIEQKQFPYGAMPSCSVTPTKPADSKKEYVFAGWQPQLAPVTGNATYKAVFSEKIAAYTVTFYDWNYEEIDVQKVKPGEAAVMPEDPTRKGYEFTGWKMDTDGATMADLKNVQSDLDVVATYKRADQGIDQITDDLSPMVNKICIDGQIYILRDNKLYTLTGQKVK